MIFKSKLKEKAVALRKEGKVYSEILKEVPVAKSTLSLWLRDVGLAKAQKQRITQKSSMLQCEVAKQSVNRELNCNRVYLLKPIKIKLISVRGSSGLLVLHCIGQKVPKRKNISLAVDFNFEIQTHE